MAFSTIQAAKSALRENIKNRISQMTLEEKEKQSKIVLEKLRALPVYQKSQRVSVYLSTADEIDTGEIVKDLLNAGKKCFVPRYSRNVMQMVLLHSVEDYDSLPLTKWNIKQPSVKDVRENALETGGLDLVVMPGVGFSKKGQRLGHGKGYYDSFLTQLTPKAATVALAFKEQIEEEVPVHPHDVLIDAVLFDGC